MPRRPYQDEALKCSYDKMTAGVYRQLIVHATGCGKSKLVADLREHHKFENKLLVFAPMIELVEQMARHIRRWNPGLEVGVEMADQFADHTNDEVIVASPQTLGRSGLNGGPCLRLQQFDPEHYDGIVIDEAHHLGDSYRRILDYFGIMSPANKKLLFGVTATPKRGDGQALGQIYDEIVHQFGILDAIRGGWLVNMRGIRVKTAVDLSGVRVRQGDFATEELSTAVNTPLRNSGIVAAWEKEASNRKTLAFCVDIAHALDLAQAFQSAGVNAMPIWGTDPQRDEKLDMYKRGILQVLTNCQVLAEGFDDPEIQCVITARPTKSPLVFTQQAGRGTRLPHGCDNLIEALKRGDNLTKTDCLLLDVVDNTSKHSLVTLNTLFGLPEQMDLKGATVTEALEEVEKVTSKVPSFDTDRITDLSQIAVLSEEAELFDIKWPQEVVDNSELKWHKSTDGSYVLLMPFGNENLVIFENALSRWTVFGKIAGNGINQQGFDDLPEAFKFAESMLAALGKHLLKYLRRESKWGRQNATEEQWNLLRKWYGKKADKFPVNLTTGEAKNLIDTYINKKFRKATQ